MALSVLFPICASLSPTTVPHNEHPSLPLPSSSLFPLYPLDHEGEAAELQRTDPRTDPRTDGQMRTDTQTKTHRQTDEEGGQAGGRDQTRGDERREAIPPQRTKAAQLAAVSVSLAVS